MDLQNAFDTITKDKNVIQKLGTVWGLFLISSIISSILQVMNLFSGIIGPLFSEEYAVLLQLLVSIVLPALIQIMILPIYLYLTGYKYKIVETKAIPDHKNIKDMFKYSLAFITASFSMNLVFGLLAFVLGAIIVLLVVTALGSLNLAIMIRIVASSIIMVFLVATITAVINSLIVPSMMFIYLKHKDISQMFDISLLQNEVEANWKNLLLLIIVNVFFNSLLGLLSFVFCFLGPLITAAIQSIKLVINGILLGQIYSKDRIEI